MKTGHLIIGLLWFVASALHGEEVNLQRLVLRLESEDFETREAAAKALGELAEGHWEKLEQQLSAGGVEAQSLKTQILAAPTGKRLAQWLSDVQQEQRERHAFYQKQAREIRAQIATAAEIEREKIGASDRYLRLKKHENSDDPEARRRAAQGKADADAYDKAVQDQQGLGFLLDQRTKVWSVEMREYETRIRQLKYLQSSRLLLRPPFLQAWSAKELPFQQRLKLPIVPEFSSVPLPEVLEYLSKHTAITIACEPSDRVKETLIHLSNDEPDLAAAISTICDQAKLEAVVDEAKALITLRVRQ